MITVEGGEERKYNNHGETYTYRADADSDDT
jgi:hypothetical protein